jgi:tight adherence protein B
LIGLLGGTVAAVLAATGAYLLFSAAKPGAARSVMPRLRRPPGRGEGIGREVAVTCLLSGAGAAAGAYVLFGGALAALVAAVLGAAAPVGALRQRRHQRAETAAEAWPRLLEELRLRTGSLGQSVPQALFEAGRRAPAEWGRAFAAAEREWLLTTDFPRTLAVLKRSLADPTADVVCETLLLTHEVGGSDIDARLADLIDDRVADLQSRKDAASRLAGVRFARRFVLLVPLGMVLAGLSIGSGRQAYSTPGGQAAVAAGLLAVAACWAWSGRLMRLPPRPRVFG